MADVLYSSVAFVVVITSFIIYHWRRRQHQLCGRGLPGPRPLPVIGNLLDVPKQEPWKGYRDLCKKHGSKFIYLNILGQPAIVIDDLPTAIEMFEKRSTIYSSRIDLYMATLIGWEWGLPFLQYGPEWRKQRRIIWQQFHPGVIPKYHPALIEGARRLVLRLLDDPDRLPEHILYAIGGTIVEATYGLTVAAEDDKYITIANRSVQDVHRLVSISAMVFQALPALARVPTWLPLPGVGILRALEEARMWAKKMRNESWEDAKAATEKGSAKPSTVSLMIENMTHLSPEDAAREEESCKSVGAVIYSAGIDTTYSIISAFFMAMALHPEVQQKARAELDAVVGGARLPTFSDRENLPYVNAILREVGRWHVVAPMGFPRATTEDDEYKGYFIAKGTAVIVNAWAILHNRELYPDPDAFKPERFLKDGKIDPDIMDPSSVSFGLGRRGCPGRHLAEASAFIYMAFVLQNLVISRPLGEDGEPIPFEPSVRGDIIIAFKDLRCVIKPRSESTLTLIRQDDSSM